MLKAVILLFFIVANIDCGVIRTVKADYQTLTEIINTLMHLTSRQDACQSTMVPDTFSDKVHQGVSEAFCKAAKALKNITPCPPIQHHLEKLQMNLLKAGEKSPSCTVDNDSLIELGTFLRHLKKLSRSIYRE